MKKQRKKMPKGKLSQINPYAAGIDLGAREHYVAVSEELLPDGQGAVRKFGADTEGLRQMCGWLKSCGVDKVAMEATGI